MRMTPSCTVLGFLYVMYQLRPKAAMMTAAAAAAMMSVLRFILSYLCLRRKISSPM